MTVEITLARGVIIAAAGMGAGFVNAIAGSGSLITFPTLVALGFPPITANISNNVGILPGSLSAIVGYRRELRGQGHRLRALAPGVAAGSLCGALLLFVLPAKYFSFIVPFLVLLAVALLALQPRLQRRIIARRAAVAASGTPTEERVTPVLIVATFFTGMYGGYFGAAQGVLFVAILGLLIVDALQRINAAKNLLTGLVNGVAALVFIIRGGIDWRVVALIAAGSIIGGQIGSHFGRRIRPAVLRRVIIIVGLIAAAKLIWALR